MVKPETLSIIAICISAFSALLAGASLLWQVFTWRSVGVRVKVTITPVQIAISSPGTEPGWVLDHYIVTVKNRLRGTATISTVGYRICPVGKKFRYEAVYGDGLPTDPGLGPVLPVQLGSYGEHIWRVPAHLIAAQPFDSIQVVGFALVKGKYRLTGKVAIKPEYLAKARGSYGHPMVMHTDIQRRLASSRPNLFQRMVLRRRGEEAPPQPVNPHTGDRTALL